MQTVAGWRCRPAPSERERIFCRRLVSAAIIRAVEDASKGDASAAAWLENTGRSWCELLGIEPGDWQTAAGRLPAARRELAGPASNTAEYWRKYRALRAQNRT